MAKWVPFTASFRVVPWRGDQADHTTSGITIAHKGSRFDYVRDLQRIAHELYDGLSDISPYIQISRNAHNDLYSPVGSLGEAVSVVPQFGNKPSLINVEGVADTNGLRSVAVPSQTAEVAPQPAPLTTRFHAGQVYQGYAGEQPWTSTGEATAAVLSNIVLLKAKLTSAASTVSDGYGDVPTLWRLVFNGIVYGVGGHHFPIA